MANKHEQDIPDQTPWNDLLRGQYLEECRALNDQFQATFDQLCLTEEITSKEATDILEYDYENEQFVTKTAEEWLGERQLPPNWTTYNSVNSDSPNNSFMYQIRRYVDSGDNVSWVLLRGWFSNQGCPTWAFGLSDGKLACVHQAIAVGDEVESLAYTALEQACMQPVLTEDELEKQKYDFKLDVASNLEEKIALCVAFKRFELEFPKDEVTGETKIAPGLKSEITDEERAEAIQELHALSEHDMTADEIVASSLDSVLNGHAKFIDPRLCMSELETMIGNSVQRQALPEVE